MSSYGRIKDEEKLAELDRLYLIGLYESILISGNMTRPIYEDDGCTCWHETGSQLGFRINTEYWL